MALSNDLISQFVKITKDDTKTVRETTAYGKVMDRVSDDRYYIQLDGSDVLTPVNTTAHVEVGDRVMVKIKNHSATISGNVSSPSASSKVVDVIGKDLDTLSEDYEIFKGIVADEALFDELKANNATIGRLIAEKADISELNAAKGRIDDLEVKNITIDGKLEANEASIGKLQTDKLDVNVANANYATIDNLASTNASIKNLEANKANVKDLEATNAVIESLDNNYANIDFANIGEAAFKKIFSESGLIRDIVVGNGTITGELVGVTIKGDLIEGNTIKADKLVVKGSDGLYYKLNFEGGTFKDGEQVPTDSLHGSVITAKSITAEKVSVNDLVAFDATIGGFKIGSNAIHSVVKESVNNTTRGIYFDNDGQMAVGDGNNFIKYYQETPAYLHIETVNGGNKNDHIYYQTQVSENNTIHFSHVHNTTYTLSFRARASSSGTTLVSCVGGEQNVQSYTISTEWQDYSFTYTTGNYGGSLTFWVEQANSSVDIANIDLVNTATEESCLVWNTVVIDSAWVPQGTHTRKGVQAVYRLAVSADTIIFGSNSKNVESAFDDVENDITNVSNQTSNIDTKLATAESLIQKLNDAINLLVTDENGTTLLNQTSEGWTFNLVNVQNAVNSVSSSMNELVNEIGDVNNSVDAINDAVKRFGDIAEYVSVGTYLENPTYLHYETAYPGDAQHRIDISTNKFTHVRDTEYILSFYARTSNAQNNPTLVSCIAGEYDKNEYSLTDNWRFYSVVYKASSTGSLTFYLKDADTTVDIVNVSVVEKTSGTVKLDANTSMDISVWVQYNAKEFIKIQGSEVLTVEPCIELGEADSDFKLMITNTKIMFKDGSSIPTYINNNGLNTKNIEVENEFRHGGFVWAKRANGNYGLSWRGVDG